MAKPARRKDVVLYPVEWIEERSGLVGGLRYFLFRNVPRDINWFQTLGAGTLTAFIVQALTGVILAMYYQPGPDTAYPSIERITNDVFAGWLVRGMHRWGASVFIILMFMHMGRVVLFGAYKFPREMTWLIGVLLLALGLLEGFTGYLLPWDQTAYWATTVGININGTGPIVGPFLAQFLQGGPTSTATRSRVSTAPHAVASRRDHRAIGLHLYLVVRLGVTSPPWSKEAAGTDPLTDDEGLADDQRRRAPDGKPSPREEPQVFKPYKQDVKTRGKPFFPHAMLHDTIMSIVVVAVIIGLTVIWKYTTPGDTRGSTRTSERRRAGSASSSTTPPTRERSASSRGRTGTSTSSSTSCGSSSGRSRSSSARSGSPRSR